MLYGTLFLFIFCGSITPMKYEYYFFGNTVSCSLVDIQSGKAHDFFATIAQQYACTMIATLEQIHADFGVQLDKRDILPGVWYREDRGDFFITNQQHVGLCVLTADCLPVIVYDPVHHAAGIAHAGWKGSAQQIVTKMMQAMYKAYRTQAQDCKVYLGPSARACCYEVQVDFTNYFADVAHNSMIFQKRDDILYFDNAAYNKHVLVKSGIKSQNLYTKELICTICSVDYCSYRKEKDKARRQVSMIILR